MYLLLGVLLVALKVTEFGPVGQWAWWVVLIPLARAAAWWSWADASGYPRRAMEAMQDRKDERRRRNMEALGTEPRRKADARRCRRRFAIPVRKRSSTAPSEALAALNANLEDPARVKRGPVLQGGAPAREFGVVDVQLQHQAVRVDGDRVAFVDERDVAAGGMASGATWPTTMPQVPPENRPSVMEADRLSPRPWPIRRRSAPASPACRAALRAEVAQHHHVAGLDPLAMIAASADCSSSKTAPGR